MTRRCVMSSRFVFAVAVFMASPFLGRELLSAPAKTVNNLLMVGPPGTGKSMLAARLPGILPPLTRQESLETTRIYSALGLLPEGVALMDQRPVRTPHHSATAQALIGGGIVPKPGEISL